MKPSSRSHTADCTIDAPRIPHRFRHASRSSTRAAPGTRAAWLSCCKGAALSALTRPASIRRCTRRDWSRTSVASVSIGGINGAIIAGNRPERRLDRLREFWERVTARQMWLCAPDGDDTAQGAQRLVIDPDHAVRPAGLLHAALAESLAVSPRGARTATSFYDSAPLRETLLRPGRFRLSSTSGRSATPAARSTC